MIPNLDHGGAEKVLVNLVNHMDQKKFEITVMSLYDEGVNRQFLSDGIIYKSCMKRSFPGVAHILKLQSPKKLYHHFVKEHYDIVISYLEGQTARIVSGCDDEEIKKLCWIHRTYTSRKDIVRLFRSEKEALSCYNVFDKLISVSKDVQEAFMLLFPLREKGIVLYNTNQSEQIQQLSEIPVTDVRFDENAFKICAMGSLIPVKGFERLISIHRDLCHEGYYLHTYIFGEGSEKNKLVTQIEKNGLSDSIFLMGYKENPYHYMKNCDLFVCSSYSEGFSTAVTESLILGLPVVTTRVSGMSELLGDNNEYGIIAENEEKALKHDIRELVKNPEKLAYYRKKAEERGKTFSTKNTVKAIEDMLLNLEKVNEYC